MPATTTSTFPGLLINSVTRAHTRARTRPPAPVRPPSPAATSRTIDREKLKVEARKRGQLRALERL